MLHIRSFTFNPFQQNTYIVYNDEGKAFLFDAGNSTAAENQTLTKFVGEKKLKLERLLLTHAHIDHIMGCAFVHETFGLLPEVHKSELFFINKMMVSANMYGVSCEQAPQPVSFLNDGDEIRLGEHAFTCILAPGHSPGSICFYNAENTMLIGGDVLFNGSIGRSDLPMGDHNQLIRSIRERLMVLPEDTRVFCGHGAPTTIGHERRTNPFLTGN